jgi:hypothetical protein
MLPALYIQDNECVVKHLPPPEKNKCICDWWYNIAFVIRLRTDERFILPLLQQYSVRRRDCKYIPCVLLHILFYVSPFTVGQYFFQLINTEYLITRWLECEAKCNFVFLMYVVWGSTEVVKTDFKMLTYLKLSAPPPLPTIWKSDLRNASCFVFLNKYAIFWNLNVWMDFTHLLN